MSPAYAKSADTQDRTRLNEDACRRERGFQDGMSDSQGWAGGLQNCGNGGDLLCQAGAKLQAAWLGHLVCSCLRLPFHNVGTLRKV